VANAGRFPTRPVFPVFLGFAIIPTYIPGMANANGPIIDMTPDGEFITPPKTTLGTILARLAAFAVLLVVAAVAFWMALFIVPVMIILGIAAYALSRNQVRRF
jgi:hypothetical protein